MAGIRFPRFPIHSTLATMGNNGGSVAGEIDNQVRSKDKTEAEELREDAITGKSLRACS